MKRTFARIAVLFLLITVIPSSFFIYKAIDSSAKNTFRIYNSSTEKTTCISDEEYVIGALLAQTDMNFELEMLKAQAIVIYTNALFERNKNISDNFDFSTDSSLYWDKKTAKSIYGKDYEKAYSKISGAVQSVLREKATFNSQPIFLPYFYCSNGKTEDAFYVWGENVEYLKPVNSEGDLINPNNKTTYSFTFEEFAKVFQDIYKLEFSDSEAPAIVVNGRTASGTVMSCTINELTMTGQNFRSALNLCSADFDITIYDKNIQIICYGNGHCVGMSQYGADFLARQGYDYKEILNHYYANIEIT